ncbi:peptidase inhibitor family I36 protein [Streptomyces sp. NPDC054952]
MFRQPDRDGRRSRQGDGRQAQDARRAGARLDVRQERLRSGWICLWEHSNYTGRRLQWSTSGTKNLSNWNFREQASSIYVSRPQFGGTLVDFRDFMPDPSMSIPADSCYDLTTLGYVTGDTWNDKADAPDM